MDGGGESSGLTGWYAVGMWYGLYGTVLAVRVRVRVRVQDARQ